MPLTVCLSLTMMAGLFLLLYSGVALIQEKRFFSLAPKEVYEAVEPKKERFPGAHLMGWELALISFFLMVFPVYYGSVDGIRRHYTYTGFLTRFLFLFLSLKAFDILFFDYYLLCRSSFFPHFYPEVKKYLGPHLFGYNKRSHLIQILLCILISILLSAICVHLQ